MTLLTHNRDHFEELIRRWFANGRIHGGVVIAVRRTPQEIASRLLKILDQVTADEMANNVIYI